jgi:CheY-like chemotaxis protein
MLVSVLGEDELEVVEASKNSELFEYLYRCERRVEEPDLVVTDLRLPGWTAPEVLRVLEQFLPGVPVVFISASASDLLAVREEPHDRVLVLPKPFDPDELQSLVHSLLNGESRQSRGDWMRSFDARPGGTR